MRRICVFLVLLGTLFSVPYAQTLLNPKWITVYPEGARLQLMGILKFKNKEATAIMNQTFKNGSREIGRSGEMDIQHIRFFDMPVSKPSSVNNWKDLVRAHDGKKISITYQIGKEYDEVSGYCKLLGSESNLFSIKNNSGGLFYIDFEQVKQVMVLNAEPNEFFLPATTEAVLFKIKNEMLFAPVTIEGLIEGIGWEKFSLIRITLDQEVFLENFLKIVNTSSDFEGVELRIAESENDPPTVFKPFIDLNKGEETVFPFEKEAITCKDFYTATVNYAGPGPNKPGLSIPVFQGFRFEKDLQLPPGMKSVKVVDRDYNLLQILSEDDVSAGVKEISNSVDTTIQLIWQETKPKPTGKTLKIGEVTYQKALVQGRFTIINTKQSPISLSLSRNVFGEITDSASASVRTKDSYYHHLNWGIPMKAGQSKSKVYKYEALIPAP